jgi:hypothetical protein
MATTPFDDWTLEDIQDEILEEIARESLLFQQGRVSSGTVGTTTLGYAGNPIDVNRAFVFGNHWQGGDGWIGPQPKPGEPGYDVTMQTLEKAFTSRNAIGEVVTRHAAGVFGREPDWSLVPRRPMKFLEEPTNDEDELILEAEALLTGWWDKRRVHTRLQRAVSYVVWASRGAMRLYIPEGLLFDDPEKANPTIKIAKAKDFEEALDLIYVSTPMYNEAVMAKDDATEAECGCVAYSYLGDDDKQESQAELSYLDGDQTVIRTITEESGENGVSVKLPLGQRLTLFEMRRPLLITQQVQQEQRALNLATSTLPRNVVSGGFLERVLLNAQMPGTWQQGQTDQPDKFIPDEYVTGAGTTNFVQGTQVTDPATGKTSLMTPQIKWHEPVDPHHAISAAAEHYASILHECDQMHVLMVTDGKIGWQSREQARADFEQSLRLTQSEAEACGRWVLETALALAEAILKKPGYYTKKLRVSFTCRTDTGPVDANERRQNDASYDAGTMSQETAMQRNNIADPDAELQRIRAQAGGDLAILEKRAAIYATLASVGDAYGAAIVAGFTPAQAKSLAGPLTDQTQAGAAPGAGNAPVPPNGKQQPPPGAAKAAPNAPTTGADVAAANNPLPGGGAGQAKPAPGTRAIRMPLRLNTTRVKRHVVE